MDKLSYIDFIKKYQTENTIKVIGEIDFDVLKRNSEETLYYTLPLIERIVLEIYKLIPGANIEHLGQGTMRTIRSVIHNNDSVFKLPPYIINCIEKIYGDNGIRNKLLHVGEKNKKVKINFLEINFLLMKLLKILDNKLKEIEKFNLSHIEYLK